MEVVKKSISSVRLCVCYSIGLNEALESHQYPLLLAEDFFARLNCNKYFAKLDVSDSYLQIPVADKSKDLPTTNTHKGLFRYNWLPFEVKTEHSLFQRIIYNMLLGIPRTAVYLDNIVIMWFEKMSFQKSWPGTSTHSWIWLSPLHRNVWLLYAAEMIPRFHNR